MQQRSRPGVWCVCWLCLVLHPALLLFAQAPITVTVSPDTATVRVGGSKTFSASVVNTTNKAVAWSVNGVAGGNDALGKITAGGVYTAPAQIPAANTVTITAVSAALNTAKGNSAVTLLNAEPAITSISPSAVNVGPYALTINGRGFATEARVKVGDSLVTTRFVSDQQLIAIGSTNKSPDTIVISVVNPDPGTATSNVRNVTVMPPVTVTVQPSTATVRAGATRQFTATVSNNSNRTVVWSVNDIAGGNPGVGTIDDKGLYTALATIPAARLGTGSGTQRPEPISDAGTGPTVTIKAVSTADPNALGMATASILNPVPVAASLNPAALKIGSSSFMVTGSGFVGGAQVTLGGIPLTTLYVSPTQLIATGMAEPAVGGMSTVVVTNPNPGSASSNALVAAVDPANAVMTYPAAARFLEQAAWGPTPAAIAHLQQIGAAAWIDEQFNAPISGYPVILDGLDSTVPLQQQFYLNALSGQDQLRQRVAFALSQIFVVSGTKTSRSAQLTPYMRMLHEDAFTNYRTVLDHVTLHPTMGVFLDMVNNDKPNPARGTAPNENYGREVLQLFSLGLVKLNQDGSQQRTGLGETIPTYDENIIKQFALAFTGWTYPTQPGQVLRAHNPQYYGGPMEPWEENHDKSIKTLLDGATVAGGQSARADLTAALDNMFNHPNVGPFIALRLIQRLTTSNASAAYVSRVAGVFNNNGSGVRGDLRAVVRQILLDPEAQLSGGVQGKLDEPVLLTIRLLRALNGSLRPEHRLMDQATNMGQRLFYAPSVFNYFSPAYRIPGTAIVGPEFQIESPSVAMVRANFVYNLSRNAIGSVAIDLAPFEQMSSDPSIVIEVLNRALLHGTMSAETRASILAALQATTDVRVRARNAIYLVGTSSQYQVQH